MSGQMPVVRKCVSRALRSTESRNIQNGRLNEKCCAIDLGPGKGSKTVCSSLGSVLGEISNFVFSCSEFPFSWYLNQNKGGLYVSRTRFHSERGPLCVAEGKVLCFLRTPQKSGPPTPNIKEDTTF